VTFEIRNSKFAIPSYDSSAQIDPPSGFFRLSAVADTLASNDRVSYE